MIDHASARRAPAPLDGGDQSAGATAPATEPPEEASPVDDESASDEPGGCDDPVRLYLRKMKLVPLLTRGGEVALAKRIESGQRRIWQAALKTDVGLDAIAALFERLQASEVDAGEVFEDGKDEAWQLEQLGRDGQTRKAIERVQSLRRRLRKHRATTNRPPATRRHHRSSDDDIRGELAECLAGSCLCREQMDAIVTSLKRLLGCLEAERLAAQGDERLGRPRRPRTAGRRALMAAGVNEQGLRRTVAEIEAGECEASRAKDEMVQANLRLVVGVANRYSHRGLDLLDLVQEGNIGLMRAVDKFDYRLGYKFATYAMWWIRQSISRAVSDQSRTIRIPVRVNEVMGKARHLQAFLSRKHGREATTQELAAELHMPAEKLDQFLEVARQPISMHTPLGADGDACVGDLVKDESATSAVDAAVKNEAATEAERLLATLTPREEKVLRLRFGIAQKEEQTLEQLGKAFGLTRERIRQIEAKALEKLRQTSRRLGRGSLVDG